VICLSPQFCFSQVARYLQVEKNEPFHEVRNNASWFKMLSDHEDSIFFMTPSVNRKGTRPIFSTKNDLDSLFFIVPESSTSFHKERILSFTVLNDFFILIGSQKIYIFNAPEKSGEIVLRHEIPNKYGLTESYKLDDKTVFLRVFYDYHPLDESDKHVWAKLNPRSGKIWSIKKMSDQDIAFSYFVNNLVDVHQGQILRSESTQYLLRIYDKNFNVIDSIYSKELDSINNVDRSFIKSTNFFSKAKISKLKKYDDSLLTRIRKSFFLNDSTIMVLLKPKQKEKLRVDVWRRSGEFWNLHLQDSSSIWYEEGESYDDENLIYSDFYQNVCDLVYLGGYSFIRFYFPFIQTLNVENYNENRDYLKKQRNTIQNGKAPLGIKLLKIYVDNP